MTLPLRTALEARIREAAVEALEKRWVKAFLFWGAFLAAWLYGQRVAHALVEVL